MKALRAATEAGLSLEVGRKRINARREACQDIEEFRGKT